MHGQPMSSKAMEVPRKMGTFIPITATFFMFYLYVRITPAQSFLGGMTDKKRMSRRLLAYAWEH